MGRMKELYTMLRKDHGKPAGQWSLWCKRPKTWREKERVIIEAILTQRTNWKNVTTAVGNLDAIGCLGLEKIVKAELPALAALIKSSGFYRQKAERLKLIASFILNDCGGIRHAERIPLAEFREQLLLVKGIGNETADDILLYAFEKPVFVIDEYTRRFATRHRLTEDLSYRDLQRLFEEGVRRDYRLYQDFHALIVIDGKERR